MTRRGQIAGMAACLILGFAGVFFCALAHRPSHAEREVETVEQVRTVIVREHIEAEQQARATERIVERRVIGGCPACVPPHSVRAADAASCPAPAEASLPSVPGNVILEERIIERAMAQRARRQLDLATAEEEASAGHSERQRIERPLALRWRLSVLAGYAWSDGEPVYGLAAGARVIGPFELGAWGIMSAELRGAAGLSVGLRW